MVYEWLDPHQRVVTPERTAIGRPPGVADGVGPHAMAHAELENAREATPCRHARHEALQDSELRGWACIMRTIRTMVSPVIRLSASRGSINSKDEPQREQKSRTLPALKPSLSDAAAIDHTMRRAGFQRPRVGHRFLLDRQNRVIRVAEDKIGEALTEARRIDALLDDAQALERPAGIFIAQG